MRRLVGITVMAMSSLAEKVPAHEVEDLLPGEVLHRHHGISHGSS